MKNKLSILILFIISILNIHSQNYNREAAAAYANKWWNGRNPIYNNYTNSTSDRDCANFGSQCLITRERQLK